MAQSDITFHDGDYEITHPLRPLLPAGILSWLLFAICFVAALKLSAEDIPLALLRPWTIVTLLYLTMWGVFNGVMAWQRPNARDAVIIWSHAARAIIYGGHIVVIWMLLAFFHRLAPLHAILLLAIIVSYAPTQILVSPENYQAIRVGAVAIYGTSAFLVWQLDEPIFRFFAVILVGFAAIFFYFSKVIFHAVVKAVQERVKSQKIAHELGIANRLIAASRDAKTRFIATASHDLGQPLQAASLFFDQTLRAKDEDQRRRAIEGVKRAFADADGLIAHMLAHLRLESDAVEPHLSRFAIGPLVRRIATQFQPAASAQNIEIRFVPSRHKFHADRTLLERAIGNLVQNALIHSGGSKILMGTRLLPNSGLARLWVIDNGRGVAASEHDQIFDDYYRAIDAPMGSHGQRGFGLGLSSVRRIAALLDGQAGISPNWKNGAAFYMDVPTASPLKILKPAPEART